MNRTLRSLGLFGLVLGLAVPLRLPAAHAAGEAAKPGTSEVKDLSDDYRALLEKMPKVADALRPKDPETAGRLLEAYRKALEARTEGEIDQLFRALSDGRQGEAKDRQEQVAQNLRVLRELLTQRPHEDQQKLLKELERMRETLERIQAAEKALADKSRPAAEGEELSEALAKAAAELQQIASEHAALGGKPADAAKEQALSERTQAAAEKLKADLGNREAAKAAGQDEAIKQAGREAAGASKDMEKGAKTLGEKGGDPSASRKEAQERLAEALRQLEKAKRRVDEQLEKGRLAEDKGQQDELKEQTEKAAEEMKKPESPAAEAGEKAKSAAQAMSQASSSMSSGQAGQTQKSQQEALEQLRKAIDDIKRKEDEARDKERQQELFQLADELKRILESQVKIHAETAALDLLKAGKPFGRPEQIRLAKAAADQASLAGAVQPTLEKLEKEQAEVFAWALKGAKDDMAHAASRLEKSDTGAMTQEVQAGIEATLQRLIDSLLEEARKPKPPSDGGGGGGGGKPPPLAPPAAQLRFLKKLQEDVLRRTEAVDGARLADHDYENLTPEERERIDRLARDEGRIHGVAKEWADKLEKGMMPP